MGRIHQSQQISLAAFGNVNHTSQVTTYTESYFLGTFRDINLFLFCFRSENGQAEEDEETQQLKPSPAKRAKIEESKEQIPSPLNLNQLKHYGKINL